MTLRPHLFASALVLLWVAAGAGAQTAPDFRGRYGPPASATYTRRPSIDAEYGAPLAESYVVRRDILLAVTFGAGGEVCRLELKPFSSSPELFPATEAFSPEEAAAILDQVAPAEARGKAVGLDTFPRADASFEFEEYEHLTLAREARPASAGGGLRAVRVGWKARACDAPGSPEKTPPDPDSCFNTGGRRK